MYYNTKASGARIRELCIAKNLAQDELAEHMNVSHGYISVIESGKRGCSVDLMIQIFEILGTSLDYLILGKCHDVLDIGIVTLCILTHIFEPKTQCVTLFLASFS
mgnify:CR=1 FL=1